jgi:putative tryptophan/tyrosine transport system substrate-binding protein
MIARREFITLVGGAAAWPLAARAQQDRVPLVGVLRPNSKEAEIFAEPFRRYMKAIGWEEGRNVRFLFVWANGRIERMPELASELVGQNADVIVPFGDPAIRAAQVATQAIPIVGMTDDMIGSALAASMARPRGNTTGVSILASELDVKRLEVLHMSGGQIEAINVLASPLLQAARFHIIVPRSERAQPPIRARHPRAAPRSKSWSDRRAQRSGAPAGRTHATLPVVSRRARRREC